MRAAFRGRRGTLWLLAIAAVIVAIEAVVFLVALPALAPTAHQVTVESVEVHFIEGNGTAGRPWFGPPYVNISGSANGFPYVVPTGSTFNFTHPFSNFDSIAHTIVSVQVAAPYSLVSVGPPPPVVVGPYEDDAALNFAFLAPGTSTSAPLVITVVAT